MQIPSDYRDLLRILNKHKVKYLIVGAYAVIYYTEPRYTKDLDIWICADSENAKRVYEALKEFGAPLKGIEIRDFTNSNLIYQIGVEPIRLDIIMGISGVKFEIAWKKRSKILFNGVRVNMIGMKDLITSKLNTKRLRDRIDVESLKDRLKIKNSS